jgi:hypothetical protein
MRPSRFVVPDDQREQYVSWDEIRARKTLTIAVPDVPYYVEKLREMLAARARGGLPGPRGALQPGSAPRRRDGPSRRARVGVDLMYPAFSVVVPGPDPIKVPLAYPIGKRDEALARFVNTWIGLKRKDGTIDAAYKHWILGTDAAPRRPRWSILDNVLTG